MSRAAAKNARSRGSADQPPPQRIGAGSSATSARANSSARCAGFASVRRQPPTSARRVDPLDKEIERGADLRSTV
jgi:hypothetical protein